MQTALFAASLSVHVEWHPRTSLPALKSQVVVGSCCYAVQSATLRLGPFLDTAAELGHHHARIRPLPIFPGLLHEAMTTGAAMRMVRQWKMAMAGDDRHYPLAL